MKKSISERRKFLAWKNLFYGCYKPVSMSHNERTCKYRRICHTCKKEHPTGLHGCSPNQKAGDVNSGESDETKKNVTFKSNCSKFDDVNHLVHHAMVRLLVRVLFLLK